MTASVSNELAKLVTEAREKFDSALTEDELNRVKAGYLGRQGAISALMRRMKELSPEERPAFGQRVNAAKDALEVALDRRREALRRERIQRAIESERMDVTLPARGGERGALHPLRRVEQDLVGIFRRLGYDVAEGPEVELDFHNFSALNFPADHPARDMQDTFHLEGEPDRLLRTHTSSVQIRTLLANQPPVRIVAPGAVYRSDEVDMTHSPCFHQIEGLFVDRGVTMAHLRGTLEAFAAELFGRSVGIRLRPSFFPFVEPGAEVDVGCVFCDGAGCRVCGQTGWIEILGAGMVHPAVFESVGLDPEEWTGFAFGMGIERIAMLRYGVQDIRLFYENDLRFLAPFA
ncbi:MAG: phenylalanine--tRNA ligase subunit alpha [Deltaproteobacteria bacterium]|nr:MAG: phenylalanine--tRNA ligase subunit alpha [Deltaproteobacteria bacterium]